MQVSSATVTAVITTTQQARDERPPLEAFRVENPPPYPQAVYLSGTPVGAAREVFERYSMHEISPNQIDQMVGDLKDAGYGDTVLMGVLEDHGAAAQNLKGSAADRPFDLVDTLFEEARAVKRAGQWNEPQHQMAYNLQWIDNVVHGAFPKAPSGRDMAQRMIEAQMRG